VEPVVAPFLRSQFASSERRRVRLTRLADGSATERDRAWGEAYLASSADGHQELDRQRLVVTLARAGGPMVSEELRQSLSAATPQRRGQRSLRLSPLLVLCAVVVALAGVAAWRLLAPPGGKAPPTISQMARLAFRGATEPAPQPDPANHALLRAKLGAVTFPDYEGDLHVRASGRRRDLIGARTVETVYYTLRTGARLSYSIVSGPSLALPRAERELTVAGVRLRIYREHRLNAVALVRHGRTCVLAGAVPPDTIVDLAAAPLLQSTGA
jgi:hypothetical protein